ncbi:MAG: guanylate kinase [Balneolaceae bacterium]
MSNRRGDIIILVAPSGSGKSTLANLLLEEFENIRFSVSATTRPPRTGEKDGVNYHFLTHEKFQEKIDAGEFLEWEEFYNGNRYGTLRSDVENQRDKGYFVLLDIEVFGATRVKKMYGEEALSIFIKPPSLDELKKRLEARGTETEESLKTRLERAGEELTYASRFDRIVVNDDLDEAYRQVKLAVTEFMTRNK